MLLRILTLLGQLGCTLLMELDGCVIRNTYNSVNLVITQKRAQLMAWTLAGRDI